MFRCQKLLVFLRYAFAHAQHTQLWQHRYLGFVSKAYHDVSPPSKTVTSLFSVYTVLTFGHTWIIITPTEQIRSVIPEAERRFELQMKALILKGLVLACRLVSSERHYITSAGFFPCEISMEWLLRDALLGVTGRTPWTMTERKTMDSFDS